MNERFRSLPDDLRPRGRCHCCQVDEKLADRPRPVPKLSPFEIGVLSKNTNELKDWRAGPFRSSSTCGEPQFWGVSEAMSAISGSPLRAGKTPSSNGMPRSRAGRPGSRPGPHMDQNVLAGYAAVTSASILSPSGRPLFRCPQGPRSEPAPPFGANVALENRD